MVVAAAIGGLDLPRLVLEKDHEIGFEFLGQRFAQYPQILPHVQGGLQKLLLVRVSARQSPVPVSLEALPPLPVYLCVPAKFLEAPPELKQSDLPQVHGGGFPAPVAAAIAAGGRFPARTTRTLDDFPRRGEPGVRPIQRRKHVLAQQKVIHVGLVPGLDDSQQVGGPAELRGGGRESVLLAGFLEGGHQIFVELLSESVADQVDDVLIRVLQAETWFR
mmetsp:Transcript_24332/g.57464  ORF Transcript_24332/g.57464 Transcript_24332/m.57464 type:complete len:219 (+) Transcript_24332:2121-2777(+)